MLRMVRTTRAPMNPDCERWIELSDRQAVGQPLPSDAREFLDRHARECDQCSKEAAHFRALLVPVGSESQPSDQEVDNILLRATEKAPPSRGGGQRRWVVGAAAALAVAASLALWLRTGEAPSPIAAQSSTATPVPARPTQPSAPTTEPTQPAQAGCSEVVRGVLACTAAGTEITRRDLASPERFLELTRGHIVLSLEPQPQGTSFSIVTAEGRVTAVGTVFSVESSERDGTVARVLEGKVVVRDGRNGAPRPLRAGESLRLGEPKPSALSAQEQERELSLLPPDVRAALSGKSTAPAPASAAAPAATPEALLKQALSLRAQGQFRRAAEVYRKVHDASPTSAAGGAALVSLGELSLSSLNDPRGALAAFDSYLSRGGSLSQEAAFGRARALRALGRTAEERSAIERFVARYPDAPQSRVLRERLAALGP
jgi:ferric-dicitrate binding protein FerR (iron transport regulator)